MIKFKENDGYTLVEILIVVAIIAIGTTIAMYNFKFSTRVNVESKGIQLVNEIRTVRQLQIKNSNKRYYLEASLNSRNDCEFKRYVEDSAGNKDLLKTTVIPAEIDLTVARGKNAFKDVRRYFKHHSRKLNFNARTGAFKDYAGDWNGVYFLDDGDKKFVFEMIKENGKVVVFKDLALKQIKHDYGID